MDLANYKKAWKNQPEDNNKVSTKDIYVMTQMKSTSIVKWIFIIGLLEFCFWAILNYFTSKGEYMEIYDKLGWTKYFQMVGFINYGIIFVFLYLFYRNYSSISIADDTKTLMQKIIRVRKTVKFYVYFNIILAFTVLTIVSIFIVNSPNAIEILIESQERQINKSDFITGFLIGIAIFATLFIGFLFLFYYLLYGILLKKLKKNYRELTKLDEVN